MTPRTPEGKTSEPTTREGLRLLAGCLRDRPVLAVLAVVGGLVYQLALIALPWFIERAVDQGIVSGDGSALRRWAIVIIGAGILAALAEMVLGWYSTLLATTQGNRLYIALADRVAGLDTRTLARFGEGDLGMRGTRDADLVRTWLSGFASFVTGVGGFIVMIVAIMRLDPLLAVVCVLCVPPLVWINTYWFPKRFGAANTRLSAAHGSRADAVEELLSASAAVRGLGGEPALVRRHHERSATVTEHTLATGRVSADWAALSPFVPALAIGAGLGLGGLAVLRGTMSVGGIVAFTSWMSMLVLWVGVITLRVSQLSQATTAARRLQDVLLPGPTDRAEGTRPLPTSGDLTAEGISHLVDGHRILAPVDLVVRPGELVAVTGPTGSGKTTLLRVLAGLQPPTGGTVSFGGVPLAAAATAELHARIGYVPQRPVTLSGTLADNLRLGAPYTDDELREACRTAALDGYLDSAPDGLDTLVGERGSTLSGGQLQRLALARAVLRRPAVLLLDDITSAIDTTTERALLERLRAWSGTTAIVCATHRATFIDAADRALALTPARSAAPDDVTEERVSTGG
ncbi:ABC transporter ATP-binding protein/permease [Streptomyces sp. OUCMDZ-4982]|uniref:ABC transporter ATP-binding protein n=1 Tax=Streptomyces sp. OUCMDZ-4982 TaxID=2973090 RepID=UPI00215BC8B4|nr:ABC transporter ATP-binding protein [Streptomyces sp. OUCMDZ-4982]MCR8940540.1 ABC transporter ATP-binding protein/permease [Streptomyces sp. OUCMDZ-4982]